MNLEQLGWNSFFEAHWAEHEPQGFAPARVASQHRHTYSLWGEFGELAGEVSGRFRYQAGSTGGFPAVGDWVAAEPLWGEKSGVIHAVLPRRTSFSRKIAGPETQEQVLAANIDTVFLVSGLDGDFNTRRIERYLTLAWSSGARAVIVLNKVDLCDEVGEYVAELAPLVLGTPIHPVSAAASSGLAALDEYLGKGQTVALLGSSGVGKSTLINALVGEEVQEVQEVRRGDSRGRHTTTHRELIALPQGGMVIDTPGLRELQLWDADEGFRDSFSDIEELARQCRFTDCRHDTEPGCAVKQAIADGVLDPSRLENYRKLQKELAHLERRRMHSVRQAEKARWKKIDKELRSRNKVKW